jgi:hypothetical protein
MNEQDLIRALQDLVARHSQPVDSRQLSAELLARDRLRILLLAGLTALLWLGGIAGVLYMVFWFNRFIIAYEPRDMDRPASQRNGEESRAKVGTEPGRGEDPRTWSHRTIEEFHAKMELHHSLEGCLIAVPALLLAALCTVWLVFSSRRATLNQINISLAEISEQLRQMRQSAGRPDGA